MSVELSRSTKKPISSSMLVSPRRKLYLALFCDAFWNRGVPGVGTVARTTLFAGTPVTPATHVCYAVCSPASCQDAKFGLFSFEFIFQSFYYAKLFLISNQLVNEVMWLHYSKWPFGPKTDVFHKTKKRNVLCPFTSQQTIGQDDKTQVILMTLRFEFES